MLPLCFRLALKFQMENWVLCSENSSLKVVVQGLDFMAHPLYIHTYIVFRNNNQILQKVDPLPHTGYVLVLSLQTCGLKWHLKIIFSAKKKL
jgi:hypothetical protein